MAAIFAAWAAAPRAAPDDYPIHADSAQAGIGVEYLVHSVPTENGMLLAGRYLVIEAGIFPHQHEEIALAAQQFHLIVNGQALPDPDSPGAVAASMKYSKWDQQRGLQTIGSVGPVVIGPQQPEGRFPGDPSAPAPVERPTPQQDPTGAQPYQLTVDDLVLHAALPSVAVRKPIDGCLFFHYDGKAAKIRTLEVVWDAPNAPPVSLKLR
jgi:hypothetical protein